MGYNQPYSAAWAPDPNDRLFDSHTDLYGEVFEALGSGKPLRVSLYPHERIDGGDAVVRQAYLDAEALPHLLPEEPVIVTRDPTEDIAAVEAEIDLHQALALSALETQCAAIQKNSDKRATTIANIKDLGKELGGLLAASSMLVAGIGTSLLDADALRSKYEGSKVAEVVLQIAQLTWTAPMIENGDQLSPLYRQLQPEANDSYRQSGSDPDKRDSDTIW